MKIYLSAQYGRRLEMHRYRDELERAGFTVTSRWLETPTVMVNGALEAGRSPDFTSRLRVGRAAAVDLYDIDACDAFIGFLEEPTEYFSGGRHVELGYALGMSKFILIIGPRENVFHFHGGVVRLEEWGPEVASVLLGLECRHGSRIQRRQTRQKAAAGA